MANNRRLKIRKAENERNKVIGRNIRGKTPIVQTKKIVNNGTEALTLTLLSKLAVASV